MALAWNPTDWQKLQKPSLPQLWIEHRTFSFDKIRTSETRYHCATKAFPEVFAQKPPKFWVYNQVWQSRLGLLRGVLRDIGLFQGSDGTVENDVVTENLLTSSEAKFDDPSFIDGSIPSDSVNDTPPGSGASTPLLDPIPEIDEGFVDGVNTPDGSEEQDLTSSEFDRKLQEGILFDGKEVDSEKAARKMAKLDLKLGLMKEQKQGTRPDEGYGSERGKGFVL